MTLDQYLKSIAKRYSLGNATEHTFRGDLERLLKALLPYGSNITNEPKRQDCGAPDYIVTEKKDITIGYIEAKNIGDIDLDGEGKNKEQFDRYKTLDNIIFTDYLNFHLYREGDFRTKITIGKVTREGIQFLREEFERFNSFIEEFAQPPSRSSIKNPQKLAEIMAGKARLLSNVLEQVISSNKDKQENSTLKDQMDAFKKFLIPDITPQNFADVYAQTVVYGMFTARLHDLKLDEFSRQKAAELIPKSNPFLRKLFGYIAGPDIDNRIIWIVDDLTKIFLCCDVKKVLKNYGEATKTEDPIIYFYEDFLEKYNPQQKKARGVYYTPTSVVGFIVRAMDEILKTRFGLSQGLADTAKISRKISGPDGKERQSDEVHRVQILDPATGTGTFIAEIIKHIHEQFRNQQGTWNSYVENHLLPRLNGFELLMAPYAMAHMKIDLLLVDTGFTSTHNKRVKIYLTNSLEEQHIRTRIPFAEWISEEANEANSIKRDTPVLCVIGNPPYSRTSVNKGKWITKLIKDYKKEPGGKEILKERTMAWLDDDYVKFLRFGQYFIEKNESGGVLGFINPHGFLENITFRGMRWSLLHTYDIIYIIDLHGNTRKRETTPDGGQDQNVFDVQQGVSINILIKTGKKETGELARVFHCDVYGRREYKYDFLENNSLETITFNELSCSAPDFFFVPKNLKTQKSYERGFQLSELFLFHSSGILTARDKFTICDTKDELGNRIQKFLSLDDNEKAREYFDLGKDSRDWKVSYAKNDLRAHYKKEKGGQFAKICYRPFDERWTYYTGKSRGFICYPRLDLMQHFLAGENLGLVCCRQFRGSENYNHVFITKHIFESSLISNQTSENGYGFPLYRYSSSEQQLLSEQQKRVPNLNQTIIDAIARKLNLRFSPEPENNSKVFDPINLLDYIYAILHSPSYRDKYKECLKIDFPRVPYPENQKTFCQLAQLGKKMREVHLLEASIVEKYITQYPVVGSNEVSKIEYKKRKIFINSTQYFANVPETAWEFCIGSYKPAQKWLKTYKGQRLTSDNLFHYQKIIMALIETNKIMKKIDSLVKDSLK